MSSFSLCCIKVIQLLLFTDLHFQLVMRNHRSSMSVEDGLPGLGESRVDSLPNSAYGKSPPKSGSDQPSESLLEQQVSDMKRQLKRLKLENSKLAAQITTGAKSSRPSTSTRKASR